MPTLNLSSFEAIPASSPAAQAGPLMAVLPGDQPNAPTQADLERGAEQNAETSVTDELLQLRVSALLNRHHNAFARFSANPARRTGFVGFSAGVLIMAVPFLMSRWLLPDSLGRLAFFVLGAAVSIGFAVALRKCEFRMVGNSVLRQMGKEPGLLREMKWLLAYHLENGLVMNYAELLLFNAKCVRHARGRLIRQGGYDIPLAQLGGPNDSTIKDKDTTL